MTSSFSERMGITKRKSVLQIDSIDSDLKIGLWNVLYSCFFKRWGESIRGYGSMFNEQLDHLWSQYFKSTLDTRPNSSHTIELIKEYFFHVQTPWYRVYDLIEYMLRFDNSFFLDECNRVLEQECSGYRIINGLITPITDQAEIDAFETAYHSSDYLGVSTHLERALDLFSDRTNPDYRNSIKESISAVEAICRDITGEATLGEALKKIPQFIPLNSQLKKGVENIYFWTNGPDGIRHAIMDDSDVGFAEAKYMLVSCSAFINYIKSKR